MLRGSEGPGFVGAVRAAIIEAQVDVARTGVGPSDEGVATLKFAECVPAPLLARLARTRLAPVAEAAAVAGWPLRVRVDALEADPSPESARGG